MAMSATPAPRAAMLSERALQKVHQGQWSTIDWLQDKEDAEEERRKRNLGEVEGVSSFVKSGQLWTASACAGIMMGLMAVAIEICTNFVVSIRSGFCVGYFWLNKELCCPVGEDCPEFQSWSSFFGGATNQHHRSFVDFVMYILWGAVFAGTAAVFCKNFAGYGAGGGINEVKTVVSGHVVDRYFNSWTMFVKSVGVCMSTGSGLAVGKEGPFVHLGACTGNAMSSVFPALKNEAMRRDMISAGAGGGLAVAFGAPIGGVVFAIEEISAFFSFNAMMQSLICGVASVLVVKFFDVMHTGRIVQFSVDYNPRWSLHEIPAFALLGLFGGLVGALYNELNMAAIANRKKNLRNWRVTEVLVLIILSNLLNYFVPLCKGGLLELLAELFEDCSSKAEGAMCNTEDTTLMLKLIAAGIVKLGLSVVAVGSCVPAGLLVPSLVIGGLFGRAYGIFISSLTSTDFFTQYLAVNIKAMPGAYAIIGAAAVLTGVTRMTVCLAVIMFELTGSIDYLVPVVIGIVCSKIAAEKVGVESIYELGIEASKMPYLDPKKEFDQVCHAKEIIEYSLRSRNEQLDKLGALPLSSRYITLDADGCTIEQINALLEDCPFHGFPIVAKANDQESDTEEKTLVGYISRRGLIDGIMEEDARTDSMLTRITRVTFRKLPAAVAGTVTFGALGPVLDLSHRVDGSCMQVSPHCSILRLMQLFKSLGLRHVLVTEYSRFKGIITKKNLIDFIRAKEDEWHEAGKEAVPSESGNR